MDNPFNLMPLFQFKVCYLEKKGNPSCYCKGENIGHLYSLNSMIAGSNGKQSAPGDQGLL